MVAIYISSSDSPDQWMLSGCCSAGCHQAHQLDENLQDKAPQEGVINPRKPGKLVPGKVAGTLNIVLLLED